MIHRVLWTKGSAERNLSLFYSSFQKFWANGMLVHRSFLVRRSFSGGGSGGGSSKLLEKTIPRRSHLKVLE